MSSNETQTEDAALDEAAANIFESLIAHTMRQVVRATVMVLWEDGALTGEGLVQGIDLGMNCDPRAIVDYANTIIDGAAFAEAGTAAIEAYEAAHPEAAGDGTGEAQAAGQE